MTISQESDNLYADRVGEIPDFVFDDNVARVFADMIKRSVPGYGTLVEMIRTLAERYAQPDSHCYDLGCSLGAGTQALRAGIKAANCRIIAVDSSQAMISACRLNLAGVTGQPEVALRCVDIRDLAIERASVVIMNLTLQFIEPALRKDLLAKIFQGMLPRGILLLSEKVAFPDDHLQQEYTALHHGFKRSRGYSELEIAQKRVALEDVLIPESIETHRSRLATAGFQQVEQWFQCLNFVSFIAWK